MEPIKRNIMLNPGPATTTDTVKYAQVVPGICLNSLYPQPEEEKRQLSATSCLNNQFLKIFRYTYQCNHLKNRCYAEVIVFGIRDELFSDTPIWK